MSSALRYCRAVALSSVFALSLIACSTPKPEPQIASSATETSYALDYSNRLDQVVRGVGNSAQAAKKLYGGFGAYAGELADTRRDVARGVAEKADAAGKSQAYVERIREVKGSQAFLTAEGEEISKKVASSAAYAAKKKGCDVPEIYGTVMHAFKESSDKQLEKRLREGNEAHAYLDHYRESLGKKNAATLEKQADEIAQASYLVNIDMVEQMVQARKLVQEGDQVKRTLEAIGAAEASYQAEPGHTDAEKQASRTRSEKAKEMLAKLDSTLAQARDAEKTVKQRIKDSQKEYQDALAALLQAIGGKK